MTDTKQTISIAIIVLALGGFAGFFSHDAFSPDTPIWKCDSTGIISDCVNGIKSDGVRCYWNSTNNLKYLNCKEGWKLQDKSFLNIKEEQKNESDVITTGNIEVCSPEPIGCIIQ